ncbi:MAG TPA: toll/interleukin-1 receptor domain-containing protein [Terracidiphilus sp.]|nr:toll/interleukin-1 receptor domain-containing protein [Terracidiphilus sp.]
MKIFISWHGNRSEALATALKEWLPLVLYYADPWLSKSNIGAGDRWSDEIAKGLESCNFGISCVTRENMEAPWIQFEAGAITKSVKDGKVIPLLLGLDKKEISGPLAQFQAKKVEQSEIKELIFDLNKSATNPVADATLEKLFVMAWPELQNKITAIPENKAAVKPSRPEGEILEELVSGIRNLEMRFMVMKDMDAKNQELQMYRMEMEKQFMMMQQEEADRRRLKDRKPHGMEMMKMSRSIASGPGDPLKLLIVASFLRDDAPWFYEMALETYKTIKSGNREEAKNSCRRLMDAFKLLQAIPLSEEIGPEWKMLPMMIDEFYSAMDNIDTDKGGKASPSFETQLRDYDKAAMMASKKIPTK